jgi:2-iminobutanoate/2-iminopropanoate deaminase
MNRTIHTEGAPGAIGPYSQAIHTGSMLFVSGQIPLDPATRQIVGSNITDQAVRVLDSLSAIVKAAGFSLKDVVKCTCYLKNLKDFETFNGVYSRYFPENPPARECVEVSGLPKGMLVEVSAICVAQT